MASRREDHNMRSSWPIVMVVVGLVGAAFWYDASMAATGASPPPEPGAAMRAE
jgi:hypothetical protein